MLECWYSWARFSEALSRAEGAERPENRPRAGECGKCAEQSRTVWLGAAGAV